MQVITVQLVTGQSVRVEFTGNVVVSVDSHGSLSHSVGMTAAATSDAARCTDVSHPQPPPAPLRLGKPPACSLMEAIDEWLDHMRLRRKKPKSIEAFRQIAYRAMRESGWREVADLTHDNITAWIQRAATESGWKGSTINHRMTALHSLTERLYKRGLLPHDPLADAIRAEEDDSSEGARAGTLAEARAIVLRAWIREQNDRRCKGNRTLYWACLFAMGCRLDEPARWKWKHVQLELNPPRLCWTPDINKGKKRREQPIPQWLADRLREHRAQGGVTERKDAQGSATETNADDPVFPVTPNKATFAQDREAAGIPFEDYRGRKFTPHAARKFYSTFLTGAGVSEKMVDYLMRHQGGVEGRYYDPSADDCAAAVAKIPNLWPDVMGGDRKSFDDNDCGPNDLRNGRGNSFANGVASGADGRYSVSGADNPQQSSESVSRSAPSPRSAPASKEAKGPEHESDSRGPQTGQRREVQSPTSTDLKSALFGHTDAGTQLALADFLDSLARLLRKGVRDGRSTEPAGPPGNRTT